MSLEGIIREETSKWFGCELADEVEDLADVIRAEGYIKLDVDADQLRELIAEIEDIHHLGSVYEPNEHRVLHQANDLARQVLAALDGETT